MMSNKGLPLGSYNAQDALVNTLRQDGIKAQKRGVCVGASSQAIQLGLQTGNTDKFDKMIHYIYQNSATTGYNDKNDFLNSIEELKTKRRLSAKNRGVKKNNHPLSTEEKNAVQLEEDLFDHYALLNQIQVHNSPSKYSELFEKMVDQHEFNHIASVITKTDDDSTTIKNRKIWLGIYTESQIRHFMTFINKANTDKLPIAFSIKSVDHQISVFYLNDQWHLTDIACMPTKHFPNTNGGIAFMAQCIQQQLQIDNNVSTALGIGLFSATENLTSIKKMLSRLNSSDKFRKFDGLIPADDKKRNQINDLLYLTVQAINHQDTQLLKNLIMAGIDADDICWSNLSVFHLAALNGDCDQLRMLLRHHKEKNSNSTLINLQTLFFEDQIYGQTPLLIAVAAGHYDAADFLLRHGAKPSIESSTGGLALHTAISSHRSDLVKLLITNNADVNQPRKVDEVTPLLLAISKNDFAMVKLLIDLKANFRDKNGKWGTPLEYAEKSKAAEIVEYLKLKLAEPEQENVHAAASSRSRHTESDKPHTSHHSVLFKSEHTRPKTSSTHVDADKKEQRSKPSASDRHSSRHSSSEHKSHSPKMYSSTSSKPKHNDRIESEPQAAAAYSTPNESAGSTNKK